MLELFYQKRVKPALVIIFFLSVFLIFFRSCMVSQENTASDIDARTDKMLRDLKAYEQQYGSPKGDR